jgi:ribosomal protein S18 acetylase RimI-like enzyme
LLNITNLIKSSRAKNCLCLQFGIFGYLIWYVAIIREYSPLDYPEVRRNLEEAGIFYEGRDSKENYDALVASDTGLVLVAEQEGEVAGSIAAHQFGVSIGLMWALGVAEKFRRRGIATELASTAEHQLKTLGANEVWCFVDVTNKASQAMLKRFGFQTDESHKYFGPWKDL